MFLIRMLLLLTLIISNGNAADRPNIVVINIDDLGYGDIGPFGSTQNLTPHLNRMAKEGRLLKSHYAAPVCSPSRASLMTGCYPKRALPIPHVLFPASKVGLHPQEVTIAEVLKEAGYATGCIGKWHLGDQPEFLPTRQGFDYYFGLPYSNDMGTVEDGSKSNPGQKLPVPNAQQAKNNAADVQEDGVRGRGQPPLPLLENEKVIARVRAEEQTTITQQYAGKATDFIVSHADQPFFLYLPHTAVHFPLYPGMEFRGKSGHGLFSDWVQEVDWAVGQVLDCIRAHKLDQKTLVIFTSDNGGATGHGANTAPLRGQKGSTLEGGIRVPTIAWWPGKIPAGTATEAITTMMDFLPTFAAIAGAKVPSDRTIDGVNVWTAMTTDNSTPREEFLYFRGLNLQAVRKGPWKLHLEKNELYNLSTNVGESSNIAATNSDIVDDLKALAERVDKDLGVKTIGPGCRELGRVTHAEPLIRHDGVIRNGFAP